MRVAHEAWTTGARVMTGDVGVNTSEQGRKQRQSLGRTMITKEGDIYSFGMVIYQVGLSSFVAFL